MEGLYLSKTNSQQFKPEIKSFFYVKLPPVRKLTFTRVYNEQQHFAEIIMKFTLFLSKPFERSLLHLIFAE